MLPLSGDTTATEMTARPEDAPSSPAPTPVWEGVFVTRPSPPPPAAFSNLRQEEGAREAIVPPGHPHPQRKRETGWDRSARSPVSRQVELTSGLGSVPGWGVRSDGRGTLCRLRVSPDPRLRQLDESQVPILVVKDKVTLGG